MSNCVSGLQKGERYAGWDEACRTKRAWLDHIMLDLDGHTDPEGIEVRASQDDQTGSSCVCGIMCNVLRILTEVGYGKDMIHCAAYDWRFVMRVKLKL